MMPVLEGKIQNESLTFADIYLEVLPRILDCKICYDTNAFILFVFLPI